MSRKGLHRFAGVLIVCIFSTLTGLADQDAVRSIAVLEFEARGVSELEASTLTDRFRSELVRTHTFVQIERSRIDQITNEQKLQVSGVVSDAKLVEIGELLGAEFLVLGSIGKLANTYTIDLRVVEVQSGKIIASYSRDHRGAVDGLLGLFREIAVEIAGQKITTSEVIPDSTRAVSHNAGLSDILSAELKARKDAAEDYSKFMWSLGGVFSAIGGSMVVPLLGGAVGTSAVFGAGYLVNAQPPAYRLSELATTDPAIQQAYIDTYKKELRKNRARWGGGSGAVGCCTFNAVLFIAVISVLDNL